MWNGEHMNQIKKKKMWRLKKREGELDIDQLLWSANSLRTTMKRAELSEVSKI